MLGYARHLLLFLALTALMLAGPSLRPASGQLAPIDPLRPRSDSVETPKAMVTATAEFSRPDASGKSVLSVTAKIAKGWHIYSLTQAKGGPIASKIKLDESKNFKPPTEFKPTKPAEVRTYPEAWKELKIEEHHATVTWKGTIELASGVDPTALEITGAVYAQACADQCIAPKNYRFTARLAKASGSEKDVSTARENVSAKSEAGSVNAKQSPRDGVWPPRPDRAGDIRLVSDEQPLLDVPGLPKCKLLAADSDQVDAPNGKYSHRDLEATIEGRIEPAAVVPGESAKLVLSIAPNSGWFFYGLADEPVKGQSKPTLIRINAGGGLQVGRPEANAAPKSKQYALAGGGTVLYYDKPVTWTIPIVVPSSVSAGTHTIEGFVGLQTCNDTTCLVPHGVRFTGTINVSGAAGSQTAPLTFHRSSYTEAARAGGEAPARSQAHGDDLAAVASLPSFEPRNLSAPPSLPAILLLSLVGGLLLNLMPCVLPVIGLKILSFVEQGGRHRRHVLALNLWYTAGILSVFLVLATLAAFLNFGWGEQFQSTGFNVVLTGLVFIMALSFLGVWEIPIPGFAGSSTATKLAHREGFFGAFCKGILTTVLATPCSAPLLGTVFGFTLRQPPHVIYLIFTAIGLGLASPYLLIGVYPRLIRFLPKPGAWMDTFKQVMGFVMLATVVFLFTFMDRDYVVPTFALLIVLWAACWWINRTPLTADLSRRLLAWGQAALFAGLVGYFSFNLLLPGPAVLRWEPFSIASWDKHTAEGKTVLVEFTADWCLNCKVNMKVAIDTDGVRRAADANRVVPLLADYSDMSEEIKQMLEALGSRSIPFLAVFPAGERSKPIVLRDLVTKQQVIDAIEQAGPSKRTDNNQVAMRTGAE